MKQGRINRARLVNAAADLFWRNGYDGTSLADIATEADVPLGNVYYYYKSKAVLAEDVGDLIARETDAALANIERNKSTPMERIIGLIDLLSASNEARTARGCPIARSTLEFRDKVPVAAKRTSDAFNVLETWLAAQWQAEGRSEEDAKSLAIEWLSRWQGAIIIAHATNRVSILDATMTDLRRTAGSLASHNASPFNSRG